MDEERNRIGGATGMGRPFTASCEGAMGINDTIALEEDAACTATPVRRQSVVSNLRRRRWYWKNEAKRLRAALEKEQRKENVDPKPRGQRIAVQKTSTKRTGKQSAQDKGKDKDKDKGKDDDPEVDTGAMASVPDAVVRPGARGWLPMRSSRLLTRRFLGGVTHALLRSCRRARAPGRIGLGG